MSTDDDLTSIAAALYTAPLVEFTATRDARAKATTDAALSAGIRSLRKPSVAAWVVNVFARERAAQLGEALALAAELRDAQDDLDAKALAQLGRDRRALTARLAAAAADLAASRGERVTDATREAVQQTISAAFFDPDAAAAVASGRLVRALEPSETYSDLMGSIVAGGAPSAAAPESAPADEVAARRERKKAERAVRDAEQSRDRLLREQKATAKTAANLRATIDELTAREAEIERELSQLRRRRDRARVESDTAEDAAATADGRVADAEQAVADAQANLSALGDR
ncbi:transposase [Microbacterium sp. NPDC089695]|uniref:transposase n=1 Tax=Microbacterium sp. NPDC089695 TaxID=3364198 RepID=UPI003830A77E